MENNLSQFGHSFQIKSIVCYMTEVTFFEQMYDILDESYYDSDSMKWIVKECKEYYNEYKKAITFDVFKVRISSINNDVLKTAIFQTLKEIYTHLEATDLQFVK